jgi:hypothetical protein
MALATGAPATAGTALTSSDVAAVRSEPGLSTQPANSAAVDIVRKTDPIVRFIDYLQGDVNEPSVPNLEQTEPTIAIVLSKSK